MKSSIRKINNDATTGEMETSALDITNGRDITPIRGEHGL